MDLYTLLFVLTTFWIGPFWFAMLLHPHADKTAQIMNKPWFFFGSNCHNPLYSLLIAYTNDFLELDDMASASGGLLFLNGLGAISGPLLTGYLMTQTGPEGYFIILATLLGSLTVYGFYRMTQRGISDVDTSSYATVLPTASVVAVEIAQELAIEAAEEAEEI